jgi:protein-disulfide isomerase
MRTEALIVSRETTDLRSMSHSPASQPLDRRARRELERKNRRERERAAAAAAARRTRLMRLGAIVLVAAIAVAAVIAVSSRGGGSNSTAASAGGSSGPAVAGALSLSGIPQHGNVLGNPKAPVRVVEFADMQCPFCRDFAVGKLPSIVNGDVRAGRVRLEFRTLAFIGPDSKKAARFVEAAARQNRMWNAVDGLFVAQGRENAGWVTDGLLKRVGRGIAGFDLNRALAQTSSPAVKRQLQAAESLAGRLHVRSTPSFAVGRGESLRVVSVDGLASAIKSALAS